MMTPMMTRSGKIATITSDPTAYIFILLYFEYDGILRLMMIVKIVQKEEIY